MLNLRSVSFLPLLKLRAGNKTLLTILGMTVVGALSAHAQLITSLTITGGFNQDVIADGTSAAGSTSATVDGFAVFYDASYASDNGISGGAFPAGQTVTGVSSGIQYTLAPGSSTGSIKDDLLLAASASAYPAGNLGSSVSGTLTFAPLTSVQSIYVLGTSANGSSTLSYQLEFAGNVQPSDATGTISFADWGSGASGDDVTGLGRVQTNNPAAYDKTGLQLYDDVINVPTDDQSLTLTGVTLTFDGSNAPNTASIFALSVVEAPEPTTFALMASGLAGLAFLLQRKRSLVGPRI